MIFTSQTAPLRFAARPTAVLHYLGRILLASAVLMLVPMSVTWASGNVDVGLRYVVAIALLAGFGWFAATRTKPRRLQQNEALCIVALSFTLSSLVAAIPLTGYGLAPLDAWFDATSAVTTTGVSVISSVDGLPFSFHFGRCWTAWVGGLGVMVLTLAVMMEPGVAAHHLGFDDREADDIVGGTRGHAKRIVLAYALVTVLSVLMIWAAGLPLAEALTDGLSAISTTGFAARDASMEGLPAMAVVAISLTCLLGAVPFYLYYRRFYMSWRGILGDPQFIMLAVVLVLVIGVVYGFMALHTGDAGAETLGHAFAMAVSAQTTGGFSSIGIANIGPAAMLVLCGAMVVGGGLGSTAGGIKILRVIVLLRLFQVFLVRISTTRHTHVALRLGGKTVQQKEIESIVGIALAFIGTVGLAWIAFVAAGYEPVHALFEVTSVVATAGLSTGIIGPDLPWGLKLVLILGMLLGRVETTAIIILLFPLTWIGKRRRL